MSRLRDLGCGPAKVVETLLRRITPLSAGIGAVRVITARLLVPGVLAMERFVIAHEEAALSAARATSSRRHLSLPDTRPSWCWLDACDSSSVRTVNPHR